MASLRTSADPNNKRWAEDESRFGFAMLQKMGWVKGKGLGAHEDGQLTHVSLHKRDDNLGIGAEAVRDAKFHEAQSEYNSVLAILSGAQITSPSDSSDDESEPTEETFTKKAKKPESEKERNKTKKRKREGGVEDGKSTKKRRKRKEKEEKSQAKVEVKGKHHKHFIPSRNSVNKHIKNYSQADLSAILGFVEPAVTLTSSSSGVPNAEVANSHEVKSNTSVTDYFEKKLAEKRALMNGTKKGGEDIDEIVEKDDQKKRGKKSGENNGKEDRAAGMKKKRKSEANEEEREEEKSSKRDGKKKKIEADGLVEKKSRKKKTSEESGRKKQKGEKRNKREEQLEERQRHDEKEGRKKMKKRESEDGGERRSKKRKRSDVDDVQEVEKPKKKPKKERKGEAETKQSTKDTKSDVAQSSTTSSLSVMSIEQKKALLWGRKPAPVPTAVGSSSAPATANQSKFMRLMGVKAGDPDVIHATNNSLSVAAANSSAALLEGLESQYVDSLKWQAKSRKHAGLQ